MKNMIQDFKNYCHRQKTLFLSDAKNNMVHCMGILLMMIVSYQYAGLLIIPIVYLLYVKKYRFQQFGLTQTEPINLLYAALFSLFMFLGSQSGWSNTSYRLMSTNQSLLEMLGHTLGIAILEELFFRGYIGNLCKDKVSKIGCICILTVVYGLYMRTAIDLFLGLCLAIIYVTSQSIYPSIFASFVLRCLFYLQLQYPAAFKGLTQLFALSGNIQQVALSLITLGLLSIAIGFACKCKATPLIEEAREEHQESTYPVYKPTHHKRVYKRKFIH